MPESILNHDRVYTRRMNWRKAIRKRRIVRQYGYNFYDNLHQYSKNKIHCSYWMCREGYYDSGDNSELRKKISDRRELDSMCEQLNEESKK